LPLCQKPSFPFSTVFFFPNFTFIVIAQESNLGVFSPENYNHGLLNDVAFFKKQH